VVKLGNVFILGDSSSTFEGSIPAGNEAWYFTKPKNNTNVTDKSQTWWYKLINNTDSALIRNESFSGTTICNTGYGGGYCPKTSFIGRFDRLCSEGFFKENPVDTFFVFGGTNDSWAGSPVGEVKTEDLNGENLKSTLSAFSYLLKGIKKNLPNASTVVIINNAEIKEEITNGIIKLCGLYGVSHIKLNGIGRQSGHPDITGMEQIFNSIYCFFNNAENGGV